MTTFATSTTFLGATDAFFDGIEGSRTFDIAWGAATGACCLAVAAPLLWWMVCRRPVSYFGTAIDPGRWLQFAWGLFGMFMAFTNLGCRVIPHDHLDWVHPGFFLITIGYVAALGPRVVVLARRDRARSRAGVAALGVAAACLLTLAPVTGRAQARALPLPASASATVAELARRCGAAGSVIPVHGTIVSRAGTLARVRLDAVPSMRPASAEGARLADERDPATPLRAGDPFDADLSSCAGRPDALVDAHRAVAFVAGVPDEAPAYALAAGGSVPDVALVDQRGRPVELGASDGKITLLSFVFTRCPDRNICPAIAGKFAYLQAHLDPAHYHLALLTLDPPYDSPGVLAAYGKTLGADPARWSLLTGQASDVKHLLERFGVSSLQDAPGRYVHDDELILARPDGTIDRIVETAGWNPDDVIAAAQTLGGEQTNPLRRLELASIANVAAFCGGSDSVGIVVLDSVVFVLGVGLLGSLLVWWGRQIFAHDA